ncbi:hypothetical protein PHLCEN_2v3892 [Hermanssonia centrifuga]|uniref:Uncharacterized protein n=1 Tax=Hermanssonia centrifuga TaxID=98765 RepID=A0A2R6QB87_9APHY|nr:hypothetical protein PHLCEN_2v3892 [Hermanssonia centrifuga]
MAELSDAKLPLPSFLKILTSNNVPASKAMAVTGKLYKTCNTPALLAELTDLKLKDIGVDDQEDRKLVLAAIRKAGYKPGLISSQRSSATRNTSADAGPSPRHSQPDMSNRRDAAPSQGSQRTKSKRKRDQDRNEFLPDRPREELEEQAYGSLDFSEVVDEETLKPKLVVINRAPIMTAWSFVVAERLGFQREEALSIGAHSSQCSFYTALGLWHSI